MRNINKLRFQCTELKKLILLDLGDNPIKLSERIRELTSLTNLYLCNNRLTELPLEISELKNLAELYLNNNKLTEMPEEIGKLKKLNALNLSGNQLTELPEEIGELENLFWLDLRGNPLPLALDILEKIHEPAVIITAYLSVIDGKPVVE